MRNVTRMVTRYSTTLFFSTLTFCSLTQAPWILETVLLAREMPFWIASSNPSSTKR